MCCSWKLWKVFCNPLTIRSVGSVAGVGAGGGRAAVGAGAVSAGVSVALAVVGVDASCPMKLVRGSWIHGDVGLPLTIDLVRHIRAVRTLGVGSWAMGAGAQVVRTDTGASGVDTAVGIALTTWRKIC